MRAAIRRALTHGAERAARHELVLGLITLGVIGLITYVGFQALGGVPFEDRYRLSAVLPPDSPPLKDGDSVRVAGQRAGVIRDINVGDKGAIVDIELEPGNAPVGRDATARVRQRTVSGLYYIEITRGSFEREPAPEEWTIERSRTSSAGDLLPIVEQFDKDFREAMSRTAEINGTGLIGRGDDLNRALRDLRPALEQGTPILEAFAPTPGALAQTSRAIQRTGRNLAPPGVRDLEALVPAAAETFEAFANRSEDIKRILALLRPFEDDVRETLPLADPVLEDGAAMASELRPGVDSLRAALPDVNRLLTSGGTLRRQGRRLTAAADPVLVAGRRLFPSLEAPVALVEPLADEVEPISAHLARYDRETFVLPDSVIRGISVIPEPEKDTSFVKGQQAQRVLFVFTCLKEANPYPEPGEAATDVDPGEPCSP